MQPYRREEPRATMTNATDEKVDAGLAEAQKAADDAMAGEIELDVAQREGLSLVAGLQPILFHPHLAPNVKALLMQLVWLDAPLTAEELEKGTGLTPLSILHNLKPMIELGGVRARFVMTDETTGATVRKFEITNDLASALRAVKPAAVEKDDA